MKKDAMADIKEKIEMELWSPGEIRMKNRLKETLLKELKEEQRVCFFL